MNRILITIYLIVVCCDMTTGELSRDCRSDKSSCVVCGLHQICFNDGVCVHEANRTFCRCAYGFEGPLCKDRDVCEPSPCPHLFECSKRKNGRPHCSCPKGKNCYPKPTAVKCFQALRRSRPPCENGGTCVSTETGFWCLCSPGWRGSRCDLESSHCASSPCLFGGTCLNLGTGFQCFCPHNRTGRRCERQRQCPSIFNCSSKAGNGHCDEECNTLLCGRDNGDCVKKTIVAMKRPALSGTLVLLVNSNVTTFLTKEVLFLNSLQQLTNITFQLISLTETPQQPQFVKVRLRVTKEQSQRPFTNMAQLAEYLLMTLSKEDFPSSLPIRAIFSEDAPRSKKSPSLPHRLVYALIAVLVIACSVLVVFAGLWLKRVRPAATWTPPVGSSVGERLLPSPEVVRKMNPKKYARRTFEPRLPSPLLQDTSLMETALAQTLRSGDGLNPLTPEHETLFKTMLHQPTPLHPNSSINKDGETLLHLCARLNCGPQITKALLERGAHPSVQDRSGRTPLASAAAADARETLTELLDRVVPTKRFKRGTRRSSQFSVEPASPLIEAIKAGSEDVGMLLLDSGAICLTALDDRGWTALHWAVIQWSLAGVRRILLHQDCSKELVSYAAGEMGFTPLHLAAREGRVEVAKLLIEVGGARLDIKDAMDRRPVDLSPQNNVFMMSLLDNYTGTRATPTSLSTGDESSMSCTPESKSCHSPHLTSLISSFH